MTCENACVYIYIFSDRDIFTVYIQTLSSKLDGSFEWLYNIGSFFSPKTAYINDLDVFGPLQTFVRVIWPISTHLRRIFFVRRSPTKTHNTPFVCEGVGLGWVWVWETSSELNISMILGKSHFCSTTFPVNGWSSKLVGLWGLVSLTWRIIPFSKWLITMISKSPKWCYSPSKWPKWMA